MGALAGCATTGGPTGSNATWPTYSYTYWSGGVQYVYQYPYGPLRVVTPSSPPSPDAKQQKQKDGTAPAGAGAQTNPNAPN